MGKMAEAAPHRRDFLTGSMVVAAATAAKPAMARPEQRAAAAPGSVAPPTEARAQAETGVLPNVDEAQVVDPGSDLMVDLLRGTDIAYVAAMPGSTFRGLHELIINYGGNRAPELITCVHEEVSAAMCHGYAKVAGKPMACLVHSDVGLQHASMAIFNAWCDRAPVIVLAGDGLDAATRRPGVEWIHTQADLGALVRDFVKWDDTPVSLQHYAESYMRAYEISITPPYEPVLLVVDNDLQERSMQGSKPVRVPKRAPVSPPSAEEQAIEQVAAMLLSADRPVIVADRAARTPAGFRRMIELAELLNAPVIDKGGRLNFPTNHFLNQTALQKRRIREADLILGLELTDLFGVVNQMPDLPVREAHPVIQPNTKVIAISAKYADPKANVQDMQRYYAADLTLAADAEASLPLLIEKLRGMIKPQHSAVISAREAPLRAAFHSARAAAAEEAARSWQLTPVSTARMCMELWEQIKDFDWGLVSSSGFVSQWPQRLWDMTEHHQYIGAEGGYGVGYGAPAAAGAALAHRDAGRLPVAILGDGDLMVAPGTLWTLAHHSIPLLILVHNNRAWHQETMHIQRMACRRNRGVDRAPIGTTLYDPPINYADLARGLGVWAEGPIEEPDHLASSIKRGLEVVKAGKPALIDVVSQPR